MLSEKDDVFFWVSVRVLVNVRLWNAIPRSHFRVWSLTLAIQMWIKVLKLGILWSGLGLWFCFVLSAVCASALALPRCQLRGIPGADQESVRYANALVRLDHFWKISEVYAFEVNTGPIWGRLPLIHYAALWMPSEEGGGAELRRMA